MRRIILFLFAVFVIAAWTLPSYAAEVSFDGQYRIRLFSFENDDDFQDDVGVTNSYIDQRFRTGITVRSSDDFGGYIQTQALNNTKWGTVGVNSTHVFDVVQAYLDFNVQNVNAKIGRRWTTIPADPFGIVLVARVDSAMFSTDVGPAKVYAAFLKLDENDAGTSDVDEDQNTYLIGGQFSPAENTEFGAFWLFDRDGEGSSDTKRSWIGANAGVMAGPVDLAVEGVVLTGEIQGGNDISAFALVGEASMAPNDQVGVGLIIAYGSGDDNSSDTDNEAFQGLSPSFNPTNIWFDEGVASWGGAGVSETNLNSSASPTYHSSVGNTLAFIPYATFKVNDQTKVTGKYAFIQQVEDTGSTVVDDAIGQELNLIGSYTIHSASNLNLTAQANWFFPGDGLLASTTAADDTVSEYTAKLQYTF